MAVKDYLLAGFVNPDAELNSSWWTPNVSIKHVVIRMTA